MSTSKKWYGVHFEKGSLEIYRYFPHINVHKVASMTGVRAVYGPFTEEHRALAEKRVRESIERGETPSAC